jgi:hypothetical protein
VPEPRWWSRLDRLRNVIAGMTSAGGIKTAVSAGPAAGAPRDALQVIEKDFAKGKHATVSLVRLPDQTLCVWKRPHDDSPSHQVAFRKEIKRSKTWRELGLSDVEAWWHEDKRSLLRTYVPGVLALDSIPHGTFWTGHAHARDRLALAHLILHAAKQRAYVTDLNLKNLVFDGTRWHVIDSGSIHFQESPESTLHAYREKLMKLWSLRMRPAEQASLREFLQGLTLDDPGA